MSDWEKRYIGELLDVLVEIKQELGRIAKEVRNIRQELETEKIGYSK